MVLTENIYWSCVQFVYMAITVYVGMILYTCFNTAAKITRKRRVLKKNFAGGTTSFFFGNIKSVAANSHRLFDVSIPNNWMPYWHYITRSFPFTFLWQFRLEYFKTFSAKTVQYGATLLIGKGYLTTMEPSVVKHILHTDFENCNKFSAGEHTVWVHGNSLLKHKFNIATSSTIYSSHVFFIHSLIYASRYSQKKKH